MDKRKYRKDEAEKYLRVKFSYKILKPMGPRAMLDLLNYHVKKTNGVNTKGSGQLLPNL